MMGLQAQIKKDLAAAMKARDEEKKSILRVIMGEFARQPGKELTDGEVVRILKKLSKSEKEVLARQGLPESNRFIDIIEAYLPGSASEQEIAEWISKHVDFSQFNNKIQAMGAIMAHFGDSADGHTVKKVLQDYQP